MTTRDQVWISGQLLRTCPLNHTTTTTATVGTSNCRDVHV